MANPLTPPPASGTPSVAQLPHDNRKPSHLELFNAFRDYVKHEDDLINNRLNWNFTIQGFLFAAYSLSIQKMSEVVRATTDGSAAAVNPAAAALSAAISELRVVMITVALVGLFVSILVYFSVWAARLAITKVEARWHDVYEQYKSSDAKPDTHGWPPHLYPFPGLIGGGSPEAHNFGFQAPLWLPIVFIVGWFVLVCYALASMLP